MTRRKLRQDEIDLWRKVADQTERLRPETQTSAPPKPPMPKPKPVKPPLARLPDFRLGANARTALPGNLLGQDPKDRLAKAPVVMDQKAYRRMTQGKLRPEGKIDLHGMTLDRAHPALNRFILSAQASGRRLVLVITGKGRVSQDDSPIPARRGVLKHQVPHWLATPPLAQAVIQVTSAHVSHGGEGAYYVYLRRTR